MKMRSEHLVPLPPQALSLLDEIHELNVFLKAGNMQLGKYLFPVAHSKSRVISEVAERTDLRLSGVRVETAGTLQLLEEKVVELDIVACASDNTIGRVLKKHAQASPEAAMGHSARRL